MKKCNVALIGINGFGASHLDTINNLVNEGIINFKAFCENNSNGSKEIIDGLLCQGVKYYRDYKDMLEKERELDFVVISTPIHLHTRMAVDVMTAGFNVLLEKPPAVTIQDVDKLIETSIRTGKLCAVNFLQTSASAFKELKKQISLGSLGEILNISGVGLWKRLDEYYSRTPWAGKLRMNENYVLDGTFNNPLAHLLNNMLFLAAAAGSKRVTDVTAELYHAHDIKSDDTSCIKVLMDNQIDLYYYATLCNETEETPFIIVEGTKGRALWNYKNELEVNCEGRLTEYKYEEESYMRNMYSNLCSVIIGEEEELFCSVASTRQFVLSSNGAFESAKEIHNIPSEFITRCPENGSVATKIKDITAEIETALKGKKLLSEIGAKWAVRSETFTIANYNEFKLFK